MMSVVERNEDQPDTSDCPETFRDYVWPLRWKDRRLSFRLVIPLILAAALASCDTGEPRPVPPAAADAGPAALDVGTARVDITPDYPVRLSGFGFRRAESEGVRQRLWAKALAFGGGTADPAVLITVDNLGLPDEFVERLASRLKERAGVPRNRLAVTATHTHTAPMLTDALPTLFEIGRAHV